jgi:large subunit ribosomal protein L25
VIALEGGESYNAVLQDIQFHPVTDKILHIDFYQLFEDKEIAMDIPVSIVGNSVGVRAGGSLRKNRRKLRVKALPTNLPDFIEADITSLKIGGKLYITELANDDYKFMHPDNTVVCQVKRSRASMSAANIEEDDDAEEATEE